MTLSAYQAARARADTPRPADLPPVGQMWDAFSTDCGVAGNGLPRELRAQIISLALWVDRFTSDVIAGRERIRELIEVNRMIMEGLRGPQRAAA